jgi:hypothetical protein
MVDKAADIINSQEPPNRCSQTSTYYVCKYCIFNGVCFENEPADRNCRSCQHAEPVENKKWMCNKFGDLIPDEEIGNDQPCWSSII